MELVGAYSNHSDQAQLLRKLLEITPAGPSEAEPRTSRQAHKRLSVEELERFREDYVAGTKIDDLAKVYGINRVTVMEHVGRMGLARRGNLRLSPVDIANAAAMYASGQSLADVAGLFRVAPETVRSALLKTGIPIRPRAGARQGQRPASQRPFGITPRNVHS